MAALVSVELAHISTLSYEKKSLVSGRYQRPDALGEMSISTGMSHQIEETRTTADATTDARQPQNQECLQYVSTCEP